VQYWSSNLADKSLRALVENAMNQEIRRREYARRGLDRKMFDEVENTRVPVLDLNPRKDEGKERVGKAETLAQWAPVAFVYLLWVGLFSISQMLLTNTIEEKSNRIIEVLLSSITPAEFVLGKLAGIAAVGLTMVGAWLGSLLAVLAWKTTGQSELATQFISLIQGSHLLVAFVVYFLFGYLLYAGIILAIGSVCNTLKEAQNYMGVITLLMMVPLLTMMFIPKDPNGTVATVLSWIPIYTPFIMMNRAAANPPLFDVVGTMILLVLFTAFVLWAAVKVFRIGILRTGQPPKIIEMLRWLRAD
jgi:ABC-2 type transport system permease protein